MIDPAWIALIGTITGGVGLKVAEHYLGRGKDRIDEASRLRDELRIEINAQREEIKELEAAVDKWREEYFSLREEYLKAQTSYQIELQKMKDAISDLQKAIEKKKLG